MRPLADEFAGTLQKGLFAGDAQSKEDFLANESEVARPVFLEVIRSKKGYLSV